MSNPLHAESPGFVAQSLSEKAKDCFDRTQLEFGKVLGIGRMQLSKYEKGLSAPTLELLLKLKPYSGRSLDWTVTGGR